MTPIRLFLVASFLSISVQISFSQGEYLFRGQSGFGASVDYVSSNLVQAYGGSLGVTVEGALDLNLSYATIQDRAVSGMITHSVSPGIAFFPVKQDSSGKKPTISFNFAYAFTTSAYGAPKAASSNAFSVGFLFAHQVLHSNNVILQPMFGVSFAKSSAFSVVSLASIAIGIRFSGGEILAITPTVSFQSPSTTYGASLIVIV